MPLTLQKGYWNGAAGGGSDPDFSSVIFLFIAPDSGTTLTDYSNESLTISAQNTAAPSTTQTKFQSQSLFLASGHTSPYATADILDGASQPSQFSFTGDFTLEAWCYFPSATDGSASAFILAVSSADIYGHYFGMNTAGDGSSSHIYDNVGLSPPNYKVYGNFYATNSWYYLAWVRSGSGSNNNKIYSATSGSTTLRGQFTNTGTLGSSSPVSSVVPTRMGGGTTQGFYIDSLRVTKGVARDVSSVPTAAFPTS